ncbi:MAG: NAD(P)/FAD-dependent oxidoreductase [Bryobacteraceae bacterium]|nr:NAD(P)/FAD-dependent oxidoreductase [Bryobacteraceae bacterium]
MERQYDLIVIGSGMGGLTVASLMARLRNKRVLVIERHFKAGGFTHAFQRGRFHWDVGLHYVGGMGEGSAMRRLFDLVTDGRVRWSPLPEPFDCFRYPGIEFDLSSGKQQLVESLSARFPAERRAIRRYARDIRRAAAAFSMEMMRNNGSAVARGFGRLAGRAVGAGLNGTTKDYLDAHFRDSELKAVLASQWGDYGLPPGLSPFRLHALIAAHYLDGAWYPEGGAGTIAEGARAAVERHGGRFLLSREVTEILIRDGKAAGVRLRNGEEWFAPAVVSNAGAAVTYLNLVPAEYPIPFRESLRAFLEENPPTTCLSLFIGFRRDPRELGFRGENHWIYAGLDHDRAFAERSAWIADGEPPMAYLSFPSLKDPRARAHTAEIITMAGYEPFARWRDQPWLRRDEEYRALKERLADALVRFVDRRYPGFADLVEYRELSTPLTNEFMTGHVAGGIYGLPSTPARYRPENRGWTHPRSPVPGLFLTGADAGSLGIVGALMGGVTALSWLPDGISTPAVFRKSARMKTAAAPGAADPLAAAQSRA